MNTVTTKSGLRAPRGAPFAFVVGPAVGLTGCGTGNAAQSSDGMNERLATAIEDAESAGASEKQLDVLRHAQEVGFVSFDDARNASLAAVECMVDAGVEAQYSERDDGAGVKIPTFVASLAGGNQDAISDIVDACSHQEEAWVSKIS